jgi:cyclase
MRRAHRRERVMTLPASFFEWRTGLLEVADGVFAYIQPKGSAGFSNAGLIVGPDYCVVVDTLGTNSMQEGFVSAIRRVTTRPVGLVLITHHHADHVLGTHRFMPARVVCHRACRHAIAAEGQGIPARWARKRPMFAPDLQNIPVIVPDITFEDRISVHLGEREIVFFHPGVAHTSGDAAALLPAEKALFAGDLFFNRVCPAAFQGSLGGWIRAVKGILELDIDTIVPGHGPVSGKDELRTMLAYLELIESGARDAFRLGWNEERAAREMPLGDFRGWADSDERLLEDVQRAYAGFRQEAATG